MGGIEEMRGDVDRATAASALGWWLEAGVDVAVGETARDWRRSVPAAAPVAAAAAPVTNAPRVVERPALRVDHSPWLVLVGRNVP